MIATDRRTNCSHRSIGSAVNRCRLSVCLSGCLSHAGIVSRLIYGTSPHRFRRIQFTLDYRLQYRTWENTTLGELLLLLLFFLSHMTDFSVELRMLIVSCHAAFTLQCTRYHFSHVISAIHPDDSRCVITTLLTSFRFIKDDGKRYVDTS